MTPKLKGGSLQVQQKTAVLEQLKKTPIVKVACERASVPRTTFYRWQEEDEEFEKAVDMAILEGQMTVNDMSEYQLLALIQEKNPGIIKYWLENHHPDYMKKSNELGGTNAGPTTIILHEHEDTD